jgi:hypothetical protein
MRPKTLEEFSRGLPERVLFAGDSSFGGGTAKKQGALMA